MYAMALLNKDGHLLVADGSEERILGAITYGTTHGEVKRAYGPLGRNETVQAVADLYAALWHPARISIRHWA